jgi:hypothetical protein
MENNHTNFSKKNHSLLIVCISVIFTEFYYFNWGSRALISNDYLLLNALILLLFSLTFFFFIFEILKKIKKRIDEKKYNLLIITFLTFVYFKIIQIPFFLANSIHLKSLVYIGLKKIFTVQFYPILPFLKIIIPFILLFFLILILFKKYNKIILNFIISFSLIFLVFVMNDIYKRINHLNNIFLNKNTTTNNRQVIWFILDEYDPEYINYKKYGLKLNHIKEIMNVSLIHKNSFSPSSSTLHSVPSILMKTNTKGSKIIDYQLNIINTDNDLIKFEFKNTIFNKIYNNKLNFNIISEVLPYCAMLKLNTNCSEYANRKMFFFDGIKNTYLPIEYLNKISEMIAKKEKFQIETINQINDFKNSDIFLSSKLKIDLQEFEKIINQNNNLVFFHLFVPHTKTSSSKYIRKKFNNIYPTNDDEEYLLNLKFTDILINKILNKINDNDKKDIMLILSSDHWRRSRSPEAQPSLLLIKIKSDNNKIEIFKQNSNIYIYDIINKYLSKKINFHKDIKAIFDQSKKFEISNTHILK